MRSETGIASWRAWRRLALICLGVSTLCAAASLGGCASAPSGDMTAAQLAYMEQDYQTAFDESAMAAKKLSGPASDEAAYLAGMSAQRLGRLHEAQVYLERAAKSSDRRLSGDAYSALGLLHTSRGEYAEAATALLAGAERLDGHNKANAYFYAALAQQRLGQWAEARRNLMLARGAGPDADLLERINQQMKVTGFTVQTGAYATRDNAERAAARLAERVKGLDIGRPVVVEAVDANRRRLYLVQVGQFVTHTRALLARSSVQMDSAIVVPLTR